ncbi:unnamed protein product [Clonostachys rosea f. rosea IK726]|uniref:protein acetyllysine N-acetyltransferase n=2 Tax=Bionectria ochroleuca TaxID=29856 RepID=A0A0B7JIT9_BIOOC|nr:unnamed protein product [Clonostachys rosea f. rosea IK726]
MAWTASTNPEQEYYESVHSVDEKALLLANLIKQSEHFIVFTGAGISTSAGIPDFRGPDGTWTLQAQGRDRTGPTTDTLQAIPTLTHMALVELQNRGLLQHVISQNCDGLHRRSGILPENISELHGNSNREYCKDCGKDYIRDFHATATYETSIHDHRTGRNCSRCGGDLHDSIINFGEALPDDVLDLAFEHGQKTDLCIVLGSSLKVSPANEIPEQIGCRQYSLRWPATLAICNLQPTPYDDLSTIRIFAKTDDLMVKVMEYLEIPIPPFILRRHVTVKIETESHITTLINVMGVDTDGTPASFLRTVKLLNYNYCMVTEPFIASIGGPLQVDTVFNIELEFMGHYCEPKLIIPHKFEWPGARECTYLLEYDPSTRKWEVTPDTTMQSLRV